MKKIHLNSLLLGIILGILSITGASYLQQTFAQEEIPQLTETENTAPPPSSETTSVEASKDLTKEEVDKKLDEILKTQEDLKKRLETILTQTRFLKASAGK
jgi:hypothetical protein